MKNTSRCIIVVVVVSLLALLTGREAFSQTIVYASSVPDANNWVDEDRAENAPPNVNCNMGTPDYAFNDAGTTWLVATNLQAISIPAGQAVDTINIGVLARYDTNEAGTFRLEGNWAGGARSLDFSVNSGSGDCRWRNVDLTDAQPLFWSQSDLNSLQLRIRRVNTNNNNDLRVKGFRARVTFGPDCNGNGITDARDLMMGAPDCNGNSQLDECEFASLRAVFDSANVAFGGSATIDLVANDIGWDPNQFRVVIVSLPSKGTLGTPTVNGTVTYQSDGQAFDCGSDSFTYRLEGLGVCSAVRSDPGLVGLSIPGANSDCNGNCLDDAFETGAGITDDCNGNSIPDSCEQEMVDTRRDDADLVFGGSVSINVVANDDGWDPTWMEVIVTSTPSLGTLTPDSQPGAFVYTSSGSIGACGGDRFEYRLSGIGACSSWQSNTEEVDIFVGAANEDCNENCQDDAIDIATGVDLDCDLDGVPDECQGRVELSATADRFTTEYGGQDLFDVASNDPDFDAMRHEVVVITGPQYGTVFKAPIPGAVQFFSSNNPGDCGSDSFTYRIVGTGGCFYAESQEIEVSLSVLAQGDDCNGNCQDDQIDVANGLATDCDGDGVLTECQSGIEDCNGNGVSDCTDVAQGSSFDINGNGVPDECESLNSVYCDSMLNSAGCTPSIQFLGSPSLTASDFSVFVGDVLHPTVGLMLWSLTSIEAPLFGGTLCVGQPFRRTAPRQSSPSGLGAPCDGLLIYRWFSSELISEGFVAGTEVFCQFYSRDMAAPFGAHLTDAVRFTILP